MAQRLIGKSESNPVALVEWLQTPDKLCNEENLPLKEWQAKWWYRNNAEYFYCMDLLRSNTTKHSIFIWKRKELWNFFINRNILQVKMIIGFNKKLWKRIWKRFCTYNQKPEVYHYSKEDIKHIWINRNLGLYGNDFTSNQSIQNIGIIKVK